VELAVELRERAIKPVGVRVERDGDGEALPVQRERLLYQCNRLWNSQRDGVRPAMPELGSVVRGVVEGAHVVEGSHDVRVKVADAVPRLHHLVTYGC